MRSLTQYCSLTKKTCACWSKIAGWSIANWHLGCFPIVTGTSRYDFSIGPYWMMSGTFTVGTGPSEGTAANGGGAGALGGAAGGRGGSAGRGGAGGGGGGGGNTGSATPSLISVRKLTFGPPSENSRTSPPLRNASVILFPLTKVPLVLWSTSLNRFPSRMISECLRESTVRSDGNRRWHDGCLPMEIVFPVNSWISPFMGPWMCMSWTTMAGGRFMTEMIMVQDGARFKKMDVTKTYQDGVY